MKYLAFDIEAANGYKLYSICSIGIVIADENFTVLEKTNIWINPKSVYNLNGTRKNVGIDLHLDKALLDSSPDFSEVYPRIRSLLTNPEYTVIGHAVDSDVRMLNAACRHYGLPSIDFEFLCTQLLYRLYTGGKEVRALSKIAADLGIEYMEHNSEDDAWMSLMTLKFLVEDSKMSTSQLVSKYHVRRGSNENFQLNRPITLEGQIPKKAVTQKATEKIKTFAQTVDVQKNIFENTVFCLARSLELSDTETLYSTVKRIVENGGVYSSKLSKCRIYIKNSTPIEQDLMRENRVANLVEEGQTLVVSVESFLSAESDEAIENFIRTK